MMKEALICLSVYLGTLFLMSHVGKETPNVPTPTICVERKAPPKTSKESEPSVSGADCSPTGNERKAPEVPKVAK